MIMVSICLKGSLDPKIFEKDGVFYMVLGARIKDSIGCVLMYRSTDLKK